MPLIRRCLPPLFVAICFVWAAYVMIPFALGAAGSGYTGLDTSPYGTPARPMVYRVLMPAVARTVLHLIPAAVEIPATKQLIAWRDSEQGRVFVKTYFKRQPPLADGIIFETAVVFCVCYVTLLAFLAMLYGFARALFPESLAYALLAPVLALQLLPIFSINNAYIYDFAELFFACALPTLLLKQRFRWYGAVFALATLNKETTLFMIVFFAAWGYGRIPFRLFLRLLLAQCVIYGIIKSAITLYFRDYPGELIGPPVTLAGNLQWIMQWGDYKFILLAIMLMAYRWKEKPPFLRAALPMLLAHTCVYLTLCVPGEYRDFYWSLPVMLLMIVHSLVAGVGVAGHPLFAPSSLSRTRERGKKI